MKNKYVKSMMGLMLSVSLIAGGTIGVYASDTTETATESTTEAGSEADSEAASEAAVAKEDAAEADAVYGEVKSVDGDTITFTVGTRNEVPGMENQTAKHHRVISQMKRHLRKRTGKYQMVKIRMEKHHRENSRMDRNLAVDLS